MGRTLFVLRDHGGGYGTGSPFSGELVSKPDRKTHVRNRMATPVTGYLGTLSGVTGEDFWKTALPVLPVLPAVFCQIPPTCEFHAK